MNDVQADGRRTSSELYNTPKQQSASLLISVLADYRRSLGPLPLSKERGEPALMYKREHVIRSGINSVARIWGVSRERARGHTQPHVRVRTRVRLIKTLRETGRGNRTGDLASVFQECQWASYIFVTFCSRSTRITLCHRCKIARMITPVYRRNFNRFPRYLKKQNDWNFTIIPTNWIRDA